MLSDPSGEAVFESEVVTEVLLDNLVLSDFQIHGRANPNILMSAKAATVMACPGLMTYV